ncbi:MULTISPECIES: adenylyl-sulfate kinase [unclassified Sphingobacterium]|uniref:adenylyl-sulfate kinase n=1 Tax=unclassified Sphingobacterium TaxID=2609468 RepID=UPI00104CD60A|nr:MULTISPECIES: adenylyl-sulfate kinase [unclassified Sphingobacterium]MCS3556082.1 adenylylsulfate kinase [Sphingobacterium sp. JUb21]TCR08459.1 adenylylsulfate kinase [Sphingobacterium sp. JUb20]
MQVVKPFVIWLYGLPSSGKTTIANIIEYRLKHANITFASLDGDDLRLGLNSDLGYSQMDRKENIRRAAEVAKLLLRYHNIVVCSFITPLNDQRNLVFEILGKECLLDIYLECPLSVCIERDVKGLYEKGLNGTLTNLTGITSLFEIPNVNSFSVDTFKNTEIRCVEDIFSKLYNNVFLK